MPLRNTSITYGTISKIFHWLMAVLVLGMLAAGLWMVGMPMSPDKIKLYGLHKSFGITILLLATLRLGWRLYSPPPPLVPMPLWQAFAANASHILLYALLFAMPISGWLMSSTTGFPVSVFGLFTLPDLLPADEVMHDIFCDLHQWMAYGLIALIALHVFAALEHHFLRKDVTLKRMWPWGMGILLVVAMPACAAEPVAGQYHLVPEKSSLTFTAIQNDAPIQGTFTQFSGDIRFDPKNLAASSITVEVDLSKVKAGYADLVAELQKQDWFYTERYPKARFTSTKLNKIPGKSGDDYYAEGVLNLRGIESPLTLNFRIEEATDRYVVASGTATILRTRFGVGQGQWSDTSAVKEPVNVRFRVVAVP